MSILGLTLRGKTAIVTGGSQGIGRAISLGFAEAGANVCIAVRNTHMEEIWNAVDDGSPIEIRP